MALPSFATASTVLRRSGIGTNPLHWRVPPIDTYPIVIAFAQTAVGKLMLFGAFAVLMKPLSTMWFELTVTAAIVSLAGPYRHLAALLCTAAMLVQTPHWFNFDGVHHVAYQEGVRGILHPENLRIATLVACVPIAAAVLHLARRFRDHPLGRRPLLLQHLLCFAMLGLTSSHLLHGLPQTLLWSVMAVFMAYFWFLAYALLDQRSRQPQPILFHFATFHPFYAAPSVVPMGKGAANWRSVEAKDAEELAVTQLKGLKLLGWAFFLKAVVWSMDRLVYDRIGIPRLEDAFEVFLGGGEVPSSLGITSILVNFPEQLLNMAVWGHIIIASARLAGFRMLRNSYRPLSSRSIAEFWNRYFYYFKEILVHVYFYPTYLRCFKNHPRLRIAFATFMAAGVGNFFFHFILGSSRIAEMGLVDALIDAQTYAFYCVMLSGGIILSQVRTHKPDPNAGWWRAQFVPSLGVAAFFCFLSFFDGPQRHVALAQHFAFLFHIFGAD